MAPVIEGLRRRGAGPLSVDTSKAVVVRAAGEKVTVEYDDGVEAELPIARVRLPAAEA